MICIDVWKRFIGLIISSNVLIENEPTIVPHIFSSVLVVFEQFTYRNSKFVILFVRGQNQRMCDFGIFYR